MIRSEGGACTWASTYSGGCGSDCEIVRSVALSRARSTGLGRKHIAPESSAPSSGDQAETKTMRRGISRQNVPARSRAVQFWHAVIQQDEVRFVERESLNGFQSGA